MAMVIAEVRKLNLSFNLFATQATIPKILATPERPLLAIAIAADSLIDQIDLVPDGDPTQGFRVGVGAPWVGYMTKTLYGAYPSARIVGDADDSTVLPYAPGGMGAFLGADDLTSIRLILYYGGKQGCHYPPVLPIRRGDLNLSATFTAAGTLMIPVYGRRSFSVILERQSGPGTGFDYAIVGREHVMDNTAVPTPETVPDPLQSGVIDDANTSDAYEYNGDPYDYVLVTLSAEAGSAEVGVTIKGQDR